MQSAIQAVVFDAYGTLFDVHSVIAECEKIWPGKGQRLSQLWRAKQLEYTWQRSLMGLYADFSQVTLEALQYAAASLGLDLTFAWQDRLMQAYLHLAPYPEAREALARLAKRKLAILSNGSPAMLEPLVRNAALEDAFAAVISVDALKIYKPKPEVYELAVERLGVAREAIGFVSSNCWDACGASAFGFTVFWINRTRAPLDALGAAPNHIIHSLAELPALLD